MKEKIDHLREQLNQLEEEIKETKKRMPAHSVKPPIMMDLLELEDRYYTINQQLQKLMRDGQDKEGNSSSE